MSIGSDKYEADFEPEEASNPSVDDEEHHLRMAIEVFAVRDLQVTANLYLSYSYPLLGPKPVRTQPVNVLKNTESRIDNAYQAFEFFATRSKLYPTLASTPLILEVLQTDKYEKDSPIGVITLQMEGVLRAKLMKTSQTIARIYDEWLPIKSGEDTIGSIRMKVYLEDLGQKAPGVALAEPQSTDYQTVWELELWKRAEMAKFSAELKNKEVLHLAEVAEALQAKETQREKTFQGIMAELNQQDVKIRAKAGEMQRREQRLVGLEEELKQKINDTGRLMAIKEEEMVSLKGRLGEVKASWVKEVAALNGKVGQLREELGKTEEELRKARREQDSPLVLQLQKELSSKSQQAADLEKRLDSSNSLKEKYRLQCESLKSSLAKATAQYQEEKKQWEVREREELTRFRLENSAKPTAEEYKELAEAKQMFAQLQANVGNQGRTQQMAATVQVNSVRQAAPYSTTLMKSTPVTMESDKRARLREERRRLIEDGYSEDDPLIKEFDEEMQKMDREDS